MWGPTHGLPGPVPQLSPASRGGRPLGGAPSGLHTDCSRGEYLPNSFAFHGQGFHLGEVVVVSSHVGND